MHQDQQSRCQESVPLSPKRITIFSQRMPEIVTLQTPPPLRSHTCRSDGVPLNWAAASQRRVPSTGLLPHPSARGADGEQGASGAQHRFFGVTLSNRSGRRPAARLGCPHARHRAISTRWNSWGWQEEMPHKLRAGDSGVSLAGS